MNKPRKPCIAALLSFFTIGLGHIYAGKAKKGVVLYCFSLGGHLAILLAPLVIKFNIFILVCFFLFVIFYFIFCLLDAVKTARKNATSYSLRKFNKWYIYLLCFVFANLIIQPVLTGALKKQAVKVYKIPAGSMIPTLLVGDHILVDRFIYKNNKPERGDVVIFEYPKDPSLDYVKRLVALEGDTVEIKDKKLFVNSVLQDEYPIINKDEKVFSASQSPRDNFGPVTVPENSVFVMGDNRDNSFDSRFWGFVHEDKIRGKTMSIYWSWDVREPLISSSRWSSIRSGRIGNEIQ